MLSSTAILNSIKENDALLKDESESEADHLKRQLTAFKTALWELSTKIESTIVDPITVSTNVDSINKDSSSKIESTKTTMDAINVGSDTRSASLTADLSKLQIKDLRAAVPMLLKDDATSCRVFLKSVTSLVTFCKMCDSMSLSFIQTKLEQEARLKFEAWIATVNEPTFEKWKSWFLSNPLLTHHSDRNRQKLRDQRQGQLSVVDLYYAMIAMNNEVQEYDLKAKDFQDCFTNALDSRISVAVKNQVDLMSMMQNLKVLPVDMLLRLAVQCADAHGPLTFGSIKKIQVKPQRKWTAEEQLLVDQRLCVNCKEKFTGWGHFKECKARSNSNSSTYSMKSTYWERPSTRRSPRRRHVRNVDDVVDPVVDSIVDDASVDGVVDDASVDDVESAEQVVDSSVDASVDDVVDPVSVDDVDSAEQVVDSSVDASVDDVVDPVSADDVDSDDVTK
jgi:hypothetical protein